MANFDEITIKQNASSCRGLAGEFRNASRTVAASEVGRFPVGTELTLDLGEGTTTGLLLPAVQKVREAAARSTTIEIQLEKAGSAFTKWLPSAITQKVLGSGRQGFAIKLRKW